MFQVPCECGTAIPVRSGQAGGTVVCRCGRTVAVPALSLLRPAAAEAGPVDRPPIAKHDWTAWWWGVGLVVAGELIWLVGLIVYASDVALSPTAATFALVAMLVGYLLAVVGIFTVGLGKGYALWFCLLLFFCIPFGRLVILFFPGKGMDKTP